MAVIAVGDFPDTEVCICDIKNTPLSCKFDSFIFSELSPALFLSFQSVVELIKNHFGMKHSAAESPVIPIYPVPSHEEPRCSCFTESEAAGVGALEICIFPAYSPQQHVQAYTISFGSCLF